MLQLKTRELSGLFPWIFLICNWICGHRTDRYRAPTMLSHNSVMLQLCHLHFTYEETQANLLIVGSQKSSKLDPLNLTHKPVIQLLKYILKNWNASYCNNVGFIWLRLLLRLLLKKGWIKYKTWKLKCKTQPTEELANKQGDLGEKRNASK